MMPLYCMGEVTATSFAEIWNGERWQVLRRWHAARDRPDSPQYRACAKCYRHRNIDFEDVFEPRASRHLLPVEPGGRSTSDRRL